MLFDSTNFPKTLNFLYLFSKSSSLLNSNNSLICFSIADLRVFPASIGAQLLPPAGSDKTSSITPNSRRSLPVIFRAVAASEAFAASLQSIDAQA